MPPHHPLDGAMMDVASATAIITTAAATNTATTTTNVELLPKIGMLILRAKETPSPVPAPPSLNSSSSSSSSPPSNSFVASSNQESISPHSPHNSSNTTMILFEGAKSSLLDLNLEIIAMKLDIWKNGAPVHIDVYCTDRENNLDRLLERWTISYEENDEDQEGHMYHQPISLDQHQIKRQPDIVKRNMEDTWTESMDLKLLMQSLYSLLRSLPVDQLLAEKQMKKEQFFYSYFSV